MNAQPTSSFFSSTAGLVIGLLLGGANVLLIRYAGGWCTWTGAAGLAALAAAVAATIAGWTRLRLMMTDFLLATTVLTFNTWAFSHLGNLMIYLGLFFFVLFGLIMGAALFRFLALFTPVSRPVVYALGWTFVLVSWAGGLVLEASYFPDDCYDTYAHGLDRLTDQETPNQGEARVTRQARERLAALHPGNTTIAYLKWALTECKISFEIPGGAGTVEHKLDQGRRGFAARLVFSVVLLHFGVFSQLRPLMRRRKPASNEEAAASPMVADTPSRP